MTGQAIEHVFSLIGYALFITEFIFGVRQRDNQNTSTVILIKHCDIKAYGGVDV
jgi:hypothetical protein